MTKIKTISEDKILKMYSQASDKCLQIVIDDLSSEHYTSILISPTNYKGEFLDGMQIKYDGSNYEVSEYLVNEDEEMYIYSNNKTFPGALTSLLRGNQLKCKRKPIEILN